MNPKTLWRTLDVRHSLLTTALSAGLFLPQSVFAADVTLDVSNAVGASSFSSELNWSDAGAPSAANDYFVTDGRALRTVADSGSATFEGGSLTLGNGTTAGMLIFKNQPTGSVITIDNLTLNNGEIQAGGTASGAAHIVTLAGNGITLAPGSSNRVNTGAGDRQILVTAPISGDGALVKNTAGYAKLGGANAYTGGTTIDAGVLHFAGGTPAIGTIAVNNNTTLAVNVGGLGEYSSAITGAGSIGGLLHEGLGAGTGIVTRTGSIGLGIDTSNATGPLTYTGDFNAALLKLGAGTLALSGGGTYAGGGAGFPFIVRQGEVHLTGGTHAVTGELVVGGNFGTLAGDAGHNARLQVDAGALDVSSWLSVGRGNGAGAVSSELVINGSATVTAANFSGGFNAGSGLNTPKGSITLNDSASLSVANTVNIAESAGSDITLNINGSATFSQTANANQTNVGGAAGAVGVINVNGGSASFERDLNLGFNAGSGKLVLNGGSVNVASATERWLIVGNQNAGSGEIEINSGTLTLNAGTDIRFSTNNNNTGTSVITLNGGAITGINGTSDSVLDLQTGNNAGSNNTFHLNGGTLTIAQVITGHNTNTAAFNFNGGTLKASKDTENFVDLGGANQHAYVRNGGAVIDTNGFNVTIPQALENGGSGGLTKRGAGTLTLTAANGYIGATEIEEGTLALGASGSIAGSPGIHIASGATLDVSAVANWTLGEGQTLSGDGNLSGVNLHFDANSSLSFSLTNTLTLLSGTVTFEEGFGIGNIAGLSSSTANDIYTLIEGTVDPTGLGNLGSDKPYDLGGGKSAYFQIGSLQVVVIPEPSTALLGGLGLLALLRRRRN